MSRNMLIPKSLKRFPLCTLHQVSSYPTSSRERLAGALISTGIGDAMSEASTCGSVPTPLLTNELQVTCPKGTKGDRLQISKKGETKLNLKEVEIEAVLLGSQPGEIEWRWNDCKQLLAGLDIFVTRKLKNLP